ncbi:AMP-binding protein [Ramlibacter sp.]|uniref:AMP-binding protein n=1 Tax=Ramlibacter sp. TaxID=1917967 RepID=UPI0017EE8ED8|nr:AMP-binding protein [Ramlibacter sp.]MBA2673887.1 AMP-binding protein [Ramlibacter sp.]
MPFHPQLHRHAAANPGKPAFVVDGQVRTYGELARGAKAFAAYIAALPAGREEGLPALDRVEKIVALDLGNHLLFPELFAGASGSPNACAVLDPKMLPAQVESILKRLRPDLTVTESMDSPAARIAAAMGLAVAPVTAFERLAPDSLLAAGLPMDEEDGDGTFLVNFTSGTTSQPKAYSRSRATWRASLARGESLFGLRHGPATLCPGALAHGLALYALSEALYSGGTFHTVRQWDAGGVADALRASGIERLVAVPTMISGLAERCVASPPVFPSVRDVLTAGAKLNARHVALMRGMFPQARLMEYYGASELGFISVSTVHPPDPGTPLRTVGRAFPGVGLGIRASGEGSPASGAAGTIYVNSDLVCDGYLWGDDGKSFRVDANGATVGDIGELEPNGALTVMGREGGMVITGGFNVYPSEVEGVLKNIPGVDEAVVLGVEDDHLGARLVAVLSGDVEGGKALLAEAGKALPRYKLPRDAYRARSWPMTTSGKIARGQVAQLLRDGHYDAIDLLA